MKQIVNEYQLSKTIRFGLSQKQKTRKNGYVGEIYQSHQTLKELVKISEERIQQSVSSEKKSEVSLSIDKIKQCLNLISDFLSCWQQTYRRVDQIALSKDYYKLLCKKIGFDGFWMERNKKNDQQTKKPQSSIIGLSEISKEDDKGKERKQYIIDYWNAILLSAAEKYGIAEEKLHQYEEAVRINRTDHKPNEVELRKSFLSLVHIVKDVLQPLCYGQILFPKIEKLDDSKPDNKALIEFATNYQAKDDLLSEIAEMKLYFDENGGNVPFCRATLNPNTAIKNPKSTDSGIQKEIDALGLEEILGKHQSALFYENYLEGLSARKKIQLLNDRKASLVTRSLLFKYKPIPAIIQFEIAKTLSQKLNKKEEDLLNFLRRIGQAKSPAKDYAELSDKSDFNLEAYPLKIAFDFAWEVLAKAEFHADADLPINPCRAFLKNNFNISDSDKNLRLYAQLQELNAQLSTLEHGRPNDVKEFEDSAKELVKKIDWNQVGKFGNANSQTILAWINNRRKDDGFKRTKQQIGLFRGRLKNQIRTFDDITKTNKDIAMRMGRTFAAMRDKITGAAELNKITHYAMIVEDENADKYVLLQEFTENKYDKIYAQADGHHKEFQTYSVNSVTSSAIAKMIRKKRIDELKKELNNGQPMPEMTDEEKELKNIKEWKDFIFEKRWDYEFNLKLSNKDFEQIKKEVDSKCYLLDKKYIDRDTLERLVVKQNCLLLPIINQDLAKAEKSESNQFTKDWNAVFEPDSPWRLTPEFRVSYRKPTPNYPVSDKGDKRYSRMQITGHFLCDYIPRRDDYISYREQVALFKDDNEQKKAIVSFHNKLQGKDALSILLMESGNTHKKQQPKAATPQKKENFYVFGIDRGQKELATLCVIDQDKKIVGDFDIYVRSFNSDTKQWEHRFLEKRHILDLSNLRVETSIMIDGEPRKEKVLVDLSEIKVKDKNGNYAKPDKMQIKMQQLAYIRKLQFQMQTEPDVVLAWYEKYPTQELMVNNFVKKSDNDTNGLVTFYGAAVEELEETLPLERMEKMLKEFKALKMKEKEGEDVKLQLDKLIQLEPVDNLKSGVVANMVGVIAFLLQKFEYNVYISLEDLSHTFANEVTGGIAGIPLSAPKNEGRRLDVEKYAGLGLYNFFEMQLLKKLFRIQQDSNNLLHLVPAFRAQKNYDRVVAGKDNVKGRFGIVFFVNANATSKTCPVCGTTNAKANLKKYPNAKKGIAKDGKETWLERDKSEGNDIIRCFVCGFDTTKEHTENPLKYIKSGDDNAAYLISTAAIKAYELATSLINDK